MLLHVEALAAKTEECWRARTISPGERALLCDMLIAAVSGADPGFRQQVAAICSEQCILRTLGQRVVAGLQQISEYTQEFKTGFQPLCLQVVEHVLSCTREEWQSASWLATLADPASFVAHFCPVNESALGQLEVLLLSFKSN